jgi:hypothetical protein
MVSKTSLLPLVRAHDWRAVEAGLKENTALIAHRVEKGRNWLHITCMAPLKGRDPEDSLRQADLLLDLGLGLDDPAFVEGEWKATPVWHAIAFEPNLALAEHLLRKGASPNYSLFAASWRHDDAAIELLAKYGADLEDAANPHSTPFIDAAGTGRFTCARALARHGADIDARDARGRTALHILLAKGVDYEPIATVIAMGCSIDVPGPDGRTAREIMARKKDPQFKVLAAT